MSKMNIRDLVFLARCVLEDSVGTIPRDGEASAAERLTRRGTSTKNLARAMSPRDGERHEVEYTAH